MHIVIKDLHLLVFKMYLTFTLHSCNSIDMKYVDIGKLQSDIFPEYLTAQINRVLLL